MRNILVAALIIAVSSHAYAQIARDIDFGCSDDYGVNICGTSFESSDNQIGFSEQNTSSL